MTVTSDPVHALTEAVRRGIAAVTDAEQSMEKSLLQQEKALSVGDADHIVALNATLDEQLIQLRASGEELRADVDDLAAELGLRRGTPVAEVLRSHPDPRFSIELASARNALVRVRRAVRAAASRNGSLARASLSAISSVRGILSRALAGEMPSAAATFSRLDAEA